LKINSIDYHAYELKFCNSNLGSVADSLVRKGIIVRMQFENYSSYGYACIHPWEELGDASLMDQLQLLKSNSSTPLIKQAVKCAYADSVARHKNLALYISNRLENHALCELTHPDIISILEQKTQLNFKTIKIKVGHNWQHERNLWYQLSQKFPNFKWRLDFNERLNWQDFNETLQWAHSLSLDKSIDFLEDPVCISSNLERLKEYQDSITIAIDRKIELLTQFDTNYFVGVVKPAIDDSTLIELLLKNNYQLCFTSYLDHPIGQAWAAYQATYWQQKHPKQLLTAGLLSQFSYQANPFSSVLSSSPYWHANKKAGLGFEPLITELSWTSLKT